MSDQKLVEKVCEIFSNCIQKIDNVRLPSLIDKSNKIILCASAIAVVSGISTTVSFYRYLALEKIRFQMNEREKQMNSIIVNQQISNTQLTAKMSNLIVVNTQLLENNKKILYALESNNALYRLLLEDQNGANNNIPDGNEDEEA
jgi:hypothetical protein